MDINTLLAEMAQLSPEQLENIQAFIQTRPYKREGRPPTESEKAEVLRAIRAALADAPPDANPGLERLRKLGYLDDAE